MILRVLYLFFFFTIKFIESNKINATSPFYNANSRNFIPKKADRFLFYPQLEALAEKRTPEAINSVHYNWPTNYTKYYATKKYAPPYDHTNRFRYQNLFDYVDAVQKGQYLQYPVYHYALERLEQKTIVDTCSLPQQIGNGPYRIPRWYYSQSLGRCELFYWSGCCANANNFQTQEECQKRCEKTDSSLNSIVYVPFTLTFAMRSGEKSDEYEETRKPTIRIRPAIKEINSKQANHVDVRESVNDLQFSGPISPMTTLKSANFSQRPIELNNESVQQRETTQNHPTVKLNRIEFPEYRLSTAAPQLVGPTTPTQWTNPHETKEKSRWNLMLNELISIDKMNQHHNLTQEKEIIKSPFQTVIKSGEKVSPEVGFRRFLPLRQIKPTLQSTAFSITAPAPSLLPKAQVNFPELQTLNPVYPVSAPVPVLIQPMPNVIQQPTPLQSQTLYAEAINPCAYGTTAALVHCAVPSKTCSGEQFCHVGPNRDATVCCEKPTILDPCSQPLNIGVGNAYLRRFYYDSANQQCDSYIYRGYQGNENNFLTLNDCQNVCQVNPCARGEPFRSTIGVLHCSAMSVCPGGFYCHLGADTRTSVCCPVLGSDPCSQPLENGYNALRVAPEGGLLRWYFDVSQQKCISFVYVGQKGTQNNFLSQEDCESFCRPQPLNPCKVVTQRPPTPCTPGADECGDRHDLWCHVGATQETTVCCPVEALHRCLQPLEPGVGDTTSQRWHFDARASRCEMFIYQGLKGNQNNFMTREECEANCMPNPCPIGTPFLTADSRLQTCSMSTAMSTCPIDYWCHVGPDASTTVCCPNANPNPCRLPMSSGDGLDNLERYYYDSSTKACRLFQYRGFKGNQNNFLTLKACQLTCQPLDNPCVGQPAKGPAGQPLFCSVANRDSCPVNFWCHLGASPETTICCPGATNPCSVPLAPGTGNAGLARWYYNTDDRECVPFQYNGKRGNQNNFLSQVECQRTCPEQLCLLSIDRGACNDRQTRYAYDRQISECTPFEYTGCGGNLNNFLTMDDCVATCGDLGF